MPQVTPKRTARSTCADGCPSSATAAAATQVEVTTPRTTELTREGCELGTACADRLPLVRLPGNGLAAVIGVLGSRVRYPTLHTLVTRTIPLLMD